MILPNSPPSPFTPKRLLTTLRFTHGFKGYGVYIKLGIFRAIFSHMASRDMGFNMKLGIFRATLDVGPRSRDK